MANAVFDYSNDPEMQRLADLVHAETDRMFALFGSSIREVPPTPEELAARKQAEAEAAQAAEQAAKDQKVQALRKKIAELESITMPDPASGSELPVVGLGVGLVVQGGLTLLWRFGILHPVLFLAATTGVAGVATVSFLAWVAGKKRRARAAGDLARCKIELAELVPETQVAQVSSSPLMRLCEMDTPVKARATAIAASLLTAPDVTLPADMLRDLEQAVQGLGAIAQMGSHVSESLKQSLTEQLVAAVEKLLDEVQVLLSAPDRAAASNVRVVASYLDQKYNGVTPGAPTEVSSHE